MTRALTAAGLALALVATPAFAKGDPAKGKQLAYTCTGCHGIVEYKNAYPSYRVPKIGGQNEAYIVAALTGYKKGERNHPTMRKLSIRCPSRSSGTRTSFTPPEGASLDGTRAPLLHSKGEITR